MVILSRCLLSVKIYSKILTIKGGNTHSYLGRLKITLSGMKCFQLISPYLTHDRLTR